MTLAYLCLIIAIFIPIFCTGYSKLTSKNYNNNEPRDFVSTLEGKAKRAYYAQLNAYESFPPFAAGVIIAHQMQALQQTLDLLAVCFIVSRIAYSLFYIANSHVLRSLAWFTGFGITLSLFFIGN